VVTALGLAWVQVRPNLGDHLAGAPQGASVAPVARCAWFSAAHAAAPSFHPGPRGAASLGGLSPADPSSPAPPISPGRAGPRLMPWTWSGQTPPGTGPQKYPALVAAPLVTTGRSPREVPSICGAIVGGGAARWQAATAGGRVGRRFGVGPRICALARVTYESKTMRATSSGWPAAAATPPVLASTRGSSAWRAACPQGCRSRP
jgi:hypothetical protein